MIDERIPIALVILEDEVIASPFGIIDRMARVPGEQRLQAAHKVGAAADLPGCIGEFEVLLVGSVAFVAHVHVKERGAMAPLTASGGSQDV